MPSPRSKFQSSQVSGFDPNYYLSKNQDVGNAFNDWFGQQPMNFGKYVKSHSDLENHWQTNIVAPAYGKYPAESRYSWGQKHWDKHGKGENRDMAYNVGDDMYIMSRGANDQSAKNDFAAWHYSTSGKNEGRFGSESEWFNSPQQNEARQAERDRLAREAQQQFQADLLAQQQAAAAEQARIQEASAAQAARVKGSSSTGVGTAATVKGSRLSITEAGGRKGTNRFSRSTPYQYMNTMGISGSRTGKSNLTL